jgi:hypothetical protein
MSLVEKSDLVAPQDDDSLKPGVIRLVSSVGPTLDRLSMRLSVSEDIAEAEEDDVGQLASESLPSLHTGEDQNLGDFAVGAADACLAIVVHFARTASSRKLNTKVDGSASKRLNGSSNKYCLDIGVGLADYQFARALMRLATSKATAVEAKKKRYREGVHYAAKCSVSGYRSALESRTNRLLTVEDPSKDQMLAAVMLAVAVTGSTSDRLQSDLGPRFAPLIKWLDDKDMIECADGRRKPAVLITAEGAKWLRALLADVQPADEL